MHSSKFTLLKDPAHVLARSRRLRQSQPLDIRLHPRIKPTITTRLINLALLRPVAFGLTVYLILTALLTAALYLIR